MEILQGDRMQEKKKKKEHILFVTKIPSTPQFDQLDEREYV